MANKLKDIKFLIIGGNKEQINKLKINVKNKNIFFTGHIENSKVSEILLNCDVLLMPYQKTLATANNGPSTTNWMSPLKLFEYLEYGKPIISSDLKVLREVLINEYNSLLVPFDDLNKWIDAIEILKNNDELRFRLSGNSRKTAKKYYWNERAKNIISHYNNNCK